VVEERVVHAQHQLLGAARLVDEAARVDDSVVEA
jgi:hypothetical protein